MTTAKMHRLRVFETIAPHTETQTLPLSALLDAPRRLAADVDSPINVPGFDNSSMDGYALAAATLDELAAGSGPGTHQGAGAHQDTHTQREPAVGGDPQAHPDPTERFGPIPVRGRVAAGAWGRPVGVGTAVESMTGAPLPAGTDTVIRIEDTSPGVFGAESVSVELPAGTKPRAGTFVRARGSDVREGQRVLSAGT